MAKRSEPRKVGTIKPQVGAKKKKSSLPKGRRESGLSKAAIDYIKKMMEK